MILDNPLNRVDTERADQLVLEVDNADVETQRLHVETGKVGAEPGSFEASLEVTYFSFVTEAGHPHPKAFGALQVIQELSQARRAAHRHDGNTLIFKISSMAFRQGVEGHLIAYTFDQQNGFDIVHAKRAYPQGH